MIYMYPELKRGVLKDLNLNLQLKKADLKDLNLNLQLKKADIT